MDWPCLTLPSLSFRKHKKMHHDSVQSKPQHTLPFDKLTHILHSCPGHKILHSQVKTLKQQTQDSSGNPLMVQTFAYDVLPLRKELSSGM